MALPHHVRCLLAALRKNFLLKKREWRGLVVELLLPVALMCIIIGFRVEVATSDIAAQSYVESPSNNPTWFGDEPMNATGNLTKVCNTAEPTGLCPETFERSTWSRRKEHYIGMALDGLLPLHMRAYRLQLGIVGSRELAQWIEKIPGYTGLIRYFGSAAHLESYVKSPLYGTSDDRPALFGAVEVRGVAQQLPEGQYDGDWEVVVRLNTNMPGPPGMVPGLPGEFTATDLDTRLVPQVDPLRQSMYMQGTRIYWSGGVFISGDRAASTGGFVDLQTLVFSWIYNSTRAYDLPSPDSLYNCTCRDVDTQEETDDMSRCDTDEALAKILTPRWSTSSLSDYGSTGCLGRLSPLFPVSVREVPFPTLAYTDDNFATIVANVFGLFFTLVYLWPLTQIVKAWMEDKELRINEAMKMMGMPAQGITTAWYITFSLLWVLPAILIPAISWTTVFAHSDKVIVFLFFWLFGVCVIAYCSVVVIFFERARTASVVGAMVFTILFFPYNFVKTESANFKLVACICPPAALSFGATILAELESYGVGSTWDNLATAVVNDVTMKTVLLMMLFDIALLAVLSWYLDKVLVVGFGTRQPWYFVCSKRFWRPAMAGTGSPPQSQTRAGDWTFDDWSPSNHRYEPVPAELAGARSVLIRDLRKQFRSPDGRVVNAVDGVTMNLYSGQIFCLLGHNGAGKTTTINMLSGMLPVDGGDALVYGLSLREDMASIRKILGVCPQHDIVWRNLAVWEHLRFFAEIKAVPSSKVHTEVQAIIAEVGLEEKRSSLACTLSGGQRRRLSVAIALIGSSRLVFLDEPSSGVDPFARKGLWEYLKQNKVGRTIIMTTHYMDEAEELGDRIAIMAAGEVKCLGTALFLKAKYGVGYTLTISAIAGADTSAIGALESLVLGTCPSAQKLSHAAGELVYRMPMENSKNFPALFRQFEERPAELGVDYFSVSVTTLEEVFLRVGQDHTEEWDPVAQQERRDFVRQLSTRTTESISSCRASASPWKLSDGIDATSSLLGANHHSLAAAQDRFGPATPFLINRGEGCNASPQHSSGELFVKHVHALVVKRYHNAKRDRKGWCWQCGMPVFFLTVALGSCVGIMLGEFPEADLTLGSLPLHQEVLYGAGPSVKIADLDHLVSSGTGPTATVVQLGTNITDTQFDAMLQDGYYRDNGEARYAAFRFEGLPAWAAGDTAARGIHRQVELIPPRGWVAANYTRPGVVLSAPRGSYSEHLWPEGFNVPVGTLWNETIVVQATHYGYDAPVQEVPLSHLNNRVKVDFFWNSSVRDAVPIYYAELHNQVLRAMLGEGRLGKSTVRFSNLPLPLSASQSSILTSQTSLFLALGFAFIPAYYGAFVVQERETNCKHIQMISGVNGVAYWLATWLWDMINFTIPAAMCLAVIAAFGIEEMVGAPNIHASVLVIVMYGVSCTTVTYMLSFAFKSHMVAQYVLLIIYIFGGGILEIVQGVLVIIPATKHFMLHTLVFPFRLVPNFCISDALANLILRGTFAYRQLLGCSSINGCQPFDWGVTGWDIFFMGVESIVYFAITLLLELLSSTPRLRSKLRFWDRGVDSVVRAAESTVDPDVALEAERVRSGEADGDMIVLKGLRKVYPGSSVTPPKVAVQDMHFGIPAGECFGYLGMNGAGKTTTMKMLTGEEVPSSGSATLGGFDIQAEQSEVRQLLGYCPQFDALFDTLTAREHLTLFARIKAVPPASIAGFVEQLLDALTLTPFADRQAGSMSGGTRRKLSLGIALIGNPRIVFMDEPTTGVDPESRRFLWRLISETMAGRSVILTTHSMEECEALCHRIGIMVNGRLVCLGTASHLKAVHGSGLHFAATFKHGTDRKESASRLSDFLRARFQDGARLVEGDNSQRMQFQLPKGRLPVSAVFEEVEDHRETLQLAEYSISETTLDQIFISFARFQHDEAQVVA